MGTLYHSYRGRAAIFVVYIAEAHPADGWQEGSNEKEGICIIQPKTFEGRMSAARLCAEMLQLGIPTVVDNMDNAAAEAFAAWPERIYIVGRDGRIAFKGGPGPYGFDPAEAAEALDCILGRESPFE